MGQIRIQKIGCKIKADYSSFFGDDFYQKMDAYIQTVRASKPLDGKTVAIPGDDRLFKYRENMKNGLEWNLS